MSMSDKHAAPLSKNLRRALKNSPQNGEEDDGTITASASGKLQKNQWDIYFNPPQKRICMYECSVAAAWFSPTGCNSP